MEIAIKILAFTSLFFGLAIPIWLIIQVLFQRGFKFQRSRVVPLIAVYAIAIFLMFFFWDEEKFGYNILQLLVYGSIYFFIGVLYSWLVDLKSKHWRSLIQISSLSLLSVPFLLRDFSDWQPIYIFSLWGGISGMYFLGYSVNATWRKEHTLSGAVPLGSFLFVAPLLLSGTFTPVKEITPIVDLLQIFLLVTLLFSFVMQLLRSIKVWPTSGYLLTGLTHAILLSVIGAIVANRLPEFKWNSATVDADHLMIFSILGAFSGLLTYLISLKANLLKRFMVFAFLQDRSFVINIERYAYLLVWGVLIWIAYFFAGVPGVLFLVIPGLGSLLVNYSVQFTNTVLYGWAIAVFLVFASIMGEITGVSGIDIAQPKVILWATIGGVGVGVHLFFNEIQRLIFIRRNFDIILSITLVGVLVMSVLSVYFFNVFELLGGTSSALSMLMIILFSAWLRNDRTNVVNPLWVAFSWVALMVPSIQRENPMDFSKNEARQKVVAQKDNNEPAQPYPFTDVQGTWKIDDTESTLAFTLKSKKGDTQGQFGSFEGSVKIEGDELSVDLSVQTASVDTKNSSRDESLKNDEGFFEVSKYPTMTFKSTGVQKIDTGYIATGEFTLLETTQSIEIPFNILGKSEQDGIPFIIIEGETSILPEEYGMTEASQLGDQVIIKFSINCTKE